MTEIEVNPGAKVLKISCRLFTDDLERSVKSLLSSQQMSTVGLVLNQSTLQPYFNKHFTIWQSGKMQQANLIGVEQDAEVTWVYFEVFYTGKKAQFKLVNSLLYDQLSEQVNLVVVKLNEQKENFRLTYPDSLVHFGGEGKK